MVQQKDSVVTPARFSEGMTYEDYVAGVERNQQRFADNYGGTTVSDEDTRALRDLVARDGGPAKVMVIGEDWCPDVFRGAPVFKKIADAAGIEMRFFPRDQHKDIIAEFLHHGEFESIPVAVFYTKDHEYIAHWIERPEKANDEMKELAPMFAKLRAPDKTPEEAEAAKQEYIAFQNGPIWGGWRQDTIKEIIALLDEKTK